VSRKPYIGPSDAQANAEALARRGLPYSAASGASFSVQWNWHRREPRDLREAVRMVRKAYADEVPTKLHDGPDAIGPDGTPRMTARAEGYIFGSPTADDTPKGEDALVGYYLAPFKATMHRMIAGNEQDRRYAAIVSHITIGDQGGVEAAIALGVPRWCAYLVAEHAVREFLRCLSDLKLSIPKEDAVA
jgi:hypothetical protein